MKRILPLLLTFFLSGSLSAQWVKTNGPYGGQTNCMSTLGTKLIAGTNFGVYASSDNGVNWSYTSIGIPANCSVNSFCVSAGTVFAATTNGVYKSTDASNWTLLTNGISATGSFTSITVGGSKLFVTDFSSVYSSVNNGTNWTSFTTGMPASVEINCLFARGTDSVFAGTQNGVYASPVAAAAWGSKSVGLSSDTIKAFAVIDTLVFAASSKKIFSSGNGRKWVLNTSGLTANSSINSLITYNDTLLAATTAGVFYRSKIISNWSAANTGLPVGSSVSTFTVKGNLIFGASLSGFYSTSNKGANWAFTGVQTISLFQYSSLLGTSNRILAGLENGGVCYSANAGTNWTFSNNGLPENTSLISLANSGTALFVASLNGLIYRSLTNGSTWAAATNGVPAAISITTLTNKGTDIYAGSSTGEIYKSTDNGVNWNISNGGVALNSGIASFTVSGSSIFAGTENNGVYESTNNGTSWVLSNTGISANAFIASLNTGASAMFASTHSGYYSRSTSGSTWVSSGSGLPASSFFTAIAATGSTFFGVGLNGVFMSDNNGANWEDISTGLPPNDYSSLTISGNELYLGINESGIWKRTIAELTCTFFPARLTSPTTLNVCSGTALNLVLTNSAAANHTWKATDNANTSGESTTVQNTSTLNDLITLNGAPTVADSVVYTVTSLLVTNTNNCPVVSQSITVKVNPLPSVTNDNTVVAICSGEVLNIPLTSSIPSTFSWSAVNNANTTGESLSNQFTSLIDDVLINVTSTAETISYSIRAISLDGACIGSAKIKNALINPLPTLSSTATQNAVCEGQSLSLSGQGASSYTWSDGVVDQVAFVPDSTRTYIVTGTDTNGCVNTNMRTVTVNPIPQMTSGNTGAVCSGALFSLSLSSDIPSAFVWKSTAHPFISGQATSNQTGATLSNTLNSTSLNQETLAYTVVPTSTLGNCAGSQQIISIDVNPRPSITSATSLAVCTGLSFIISLDADIASSFTWIATDNPNVSGESTTLQTGSILSNVLTTNSTAQLVNYSVIPTSLDWSCPGNSQTVAVTVNPKPQMTSTTTSIACSGNAINFLLTSNNPSSFSWLAADNSNTTGESITAASGSIISDIIANNTGQAQNLNYSVTPTSLSGSCIGVSQSVSVQINPSPTMTNVNTVSICSGVAVDLNVTSDIPASYSWLAADNSGVTGESTTSQQGGNISNTLINTTTLAQNVNYTVTPTSLNGACVGLNQNVAVTVNIAPLLTSQDSVVLCSGSLATIPLSSNIPSAYTWFATNNPNTTGESLTTQTSSTLSNTINNTTSQLQTVTYTVTPTAIVGACPGIPQTVSLIVSPFPNVTSSTSATICSGDTLNFALSSDQPCTYKWISVNNPNTSGESTVLQNSGIVNDIITNATSNPQSVNYSITATSITGSCISNTQLMLLNVRPLPAVTASASPSTSICLGESVTLIGNGAASFVWTGNVTDGVAFYPSAALTYSYTVTGTDVYGCKNTASKSITVNAMPDTITTLSVDGNTITVAEPGASYQWLHCNPNGFISGATSQSYTVIANGYYRVIVTKNNCTDTSACVWVGTLGVFENAEINSIAIFPNPAQDKLTIVPGFELESVRISDSFGRVLIYLEKQELKSGAIELNKLQLAAGVYVISCANEKREVKKKLVITR